MFVFNTSGPHSAAVLLDSMYDPSLVVITAADGLILLAVLLVIGPTLYAAFKSTLDVTVFP